jgi:hypothetical protein
VILRLHRRHRRAASAAFLALLSLCATRARAHEHITLANGFEIDCVRREVQGNTVRLYLASGSDGLENYMDVAARDVVRVEIVPDPPAPLKPKAASAPAFATAKSQQPTPGELKEMLARAGSQHNIDADLLASVVLAESGGHAHAVSRTGAIGLMQLMPGTATTLGVTDAFVPAQNVDGGTRYLDQLLTRYHDNLALALAAYNAGPGAVDRYHGIPPYRETIAYVARVIREFNRRKTVLLAQTSGNHAPAGSQ